MTTRLPHVLTTPIAIQFTPSISKLWQQLLPGAIAALLLMGLLRLGLGQSLEHLVYDMLFQLRGAIPWSAEVVVIEIDELSLRGVGPFPWQRDRYINLLNSLEPAKPKVVALDIVLSEPDAADQTLAATMQRLNRVVLAQSWDATGATLLPAPLLRAAATASGHTHQQADLDGLVRQVDLRRQGVPAFSLAVVNVYAGVHPPKLPDLDSPLWINWLGSAYQAAHYSYIDVVNGQIPAQAFRNKIVLLGVTTTALDSLQTPFDRKSPTSSVYLQATVISNLLQQNALQRPSRGWMVLLILLGGPGLSCMLSSWRFERRLLAWLSLCLGWGLLGIGLFHLRFWIPIATPLMLFSLTGAVVAVREQARTNALLRQSEERYALAVRGSNEGLWDWNLKTDEVYYSPRWQEMLGLQDEAFGDRLQVWYDRVHPDDLEALKATLSDHLHGRTAHFEHEHRMMHHDGTYHWMLSRGVAVQNRSGNAHRMAGSQTDITKRKAAEAQLWHNAYYDELTGLPNRAFFLDRLRQAIAHAAEHPLYFYAVLLLDLDRFQVVNNSLGNAIGDQLLIAFAHRIKGFLPTEAVLARLPGDEFAILLNNIEDVRDAIRTADQLRQILALPFNLDSQEVYITVSTGIALGSTRYAQPEHLLQDADTALHRAKSAGKNRHQVFEPTMHNRMLAKLKLENDLRRAISLEHRSSLDDPEDERQELLLYYQPIVQLTTGKVVGFEALCRWQHPRNGFLTPAKFITMAEETGLIVQLGWWILRQACRQMRQWQTQFPHLMPLTMSVNLSSRQFSLPDLTQHTQSILYETGLDAAYLKLEITEGTIMETGKAVIDLLHQLRALGIQLAIDDFGTGYSSLNYLYRFPINTLKIDRSFIIKMHTDQDSAEIVRTIVTLAHNLGMNVTAEGVETPEQADQLQTLLCEYGQGYYFARPLDAQAAELLLAQQTFTSEVSSL